jgi:tetratricopeptide (TPR) repeat protein
MDKATEAFKLWLELEPDSQPARQMLVSLLLTAGKLDDARPWLAKMLAADPDNAGAVFRQLPPLFARYADKTASWKLVRDLAQPYPRLAEAHWAVAQAAAAAGKHDDALAEVRQARALRPDWDEAVLLEVQLLQPGQPQQALAALKDFLEANPGDGDVRLLYARLLLESKRFKESRVEFQRLLKAHPDNAELAFAVALLSLQMGELDRAEKELQQALIHGKKDQDTVHYYLGQLNEAKKDSQAALQQYRKVLEGEYAYPARLREVYLLNSGGRLDEALEVLHRIPVQNSQQQVQLLMIEAQLLHDAQKFDASYQILQQGLEKFPDQPDLLYETALLADKLGKPDVLEQLLRKLIGIQPDNANAYNALGYSLLERNVRVDEGMQLVEKAYRLAPGDAAIIDSMGWGQYRLGKLDKSLEFLHRAFNADPNPEIAAHLGEVLWVHGDKEEAKKIWFGSLKQHPDSEPLQAVMKKFLP